MSQTDSVYDLLREAILSLDLAPGERLTERSLEREYSASRTPVRAALQRLEGEGLVTRGERGFAVASIDLAELRALAEYRIAVETGALRLAVARADGSAFSGVVPPPSSSADDGVRLGTDFHASLAGLSGNHFFAEAVRGILTRIERTRWLEVRTPDSREQSRVEHTAIVEAAGSGDADRACELLAEHIRGTNERLVATLESEPRRMRGIVVA